MSAEVAGRLDQRVTLAARVFADDDNGGQRETFEALTPAVAYAAIEQLRGSERLQAQALEITISHRVLLRFHPEVSAGTRITWGTRVLEVVGPPVEVGRRALLECYCAERGR